jgi:phosphatidylserine decarboxylase
MFEIFSNNLLWSQGWALVGCIFFIAFISFFSRFFLFLSLALFVFSLYFFRNPPRSCPAALTDHSLIVCPADGKVVDISDYHDSSEYNFTQKVSIFLSPFDVHVNWIPFSGIIEKMRYVPGKFLMAFLPKSSELNEHHDIIIRNDQKVLLVRQIAGTIARRICWWIKENQLVQQGDTYGMIRFGSRVDILLPTTAHLLIKQGERVWGGQTILARWE